MTQTIDYTILGSGAERNHREDSLSALVLERGTSMYWDRLFTSLYAAGFQRIIYVGAGGDTARAARMSRLFPGVRVLMPAAAHDPGSMVNLGLREIGSGKALVLWSDQKLGAELLSTRLLQRVRSTQAACLCPILRDREGKPAASVWHHAPHSAKGPARKPHAPPVVRSVPGQDPRSVFGFDDVAGIYDVDAFLALDGYDTAYTNHGARSVDFCIAAWASGRGVLGFPSLELRLDGVADLPATECGPSDDRARARLWLKRIAPKIRGTAFLRFLAMRRGAVRGSLREFRELRAWRARHPGQGLSEALLRADGERVL